MYPPSSTCGGYDELGLYDNGETDMIIWPYLTIEYQYTCHHDNEVKVRQHMLIITELVV
jgi:hypothetical protein